MPLDQPSLGGGPCGLDVSDESANPELVALGDAVYECVIDALMRLPVNQRDAVWMCDVKQMRYEEIARATGACLATVRTRVHRGRQGIRRRLHGEPGMPEGSNP